MAISISGYREEKVPFVLVKRSLDSNAREMSTLSSKLVCNLINYYQRKGGGTKFFNTDCNFEPTCSEYAKQVLQNKGLIAAAPIIINRLRRCNDPDKVEREADPYIVDNNV